MPVSGIVVLKVTATDNCGVSGLFFFVFNISLGAPDRSGSVGPVIPAADGVTYTAQWDTRRLSNGPYGIDAYANDNHLNIDGMPAGNTGSASLYRVLVAN